MKNPWKTRNITALVNSLSAASIDVKPVNFNWSGDNHDAYASREQDDRFGLWREVYPKFDLANANLKLEEKGLDIIEVPAPDDEDAIEKATEEANERLRESYSENNDFVPMMNYYYPIDLPSVEANSPEETQGILDLFGGSCLLAYIDDERYVLTLMGGGMDLTWDICEAYVLCGCLPPAHFAGDLPEFAGQTLTMKKRIVLAACTRSLRFMRSRLDRGLDKVKRVRDYLKKNAVKP